MRMALSRSSRAFAAGMAATSACAIGPRRKTRELQAGSPRNGGILAAFCWTRGSIPAWHFPVPRGSIPHQPLAQPGEHLLTPPQLAPSSSSAAAAARAERYLPGQAGSAPSVGGFTRVGSAPQRPLPERKLRAEQRGVRRALAASAARVAAQFIEAGQAMILVRLLSDAGIVPLSALL